MGYKGDGERAGKKERLGQGRSKSLCYSMLGMLKEALRIMFYKCSL